MAKKYIPGGSCLICDKGTVPTKLIVTNHNNTKVYGEFLASEADTKFGENIMPFGACSLKNGAPCTFAPLYWDKCNKGVKVNSYKLVFEDAKLLCVTGGKITPSITATSGTGTIQFGLTGIGSQIFSWRDYNKSIDFIQRGIIYNVEKGRINLTRANSDFDYRRHGNYGEMNDNVFHRADGWDDIRAEHPLIDIDKPTASGIDAAYNKGGINGDYKGVDSKYGGAQLQNTTNNGRELSQRWIRNHVENGAVKPEHRAEMLRRNNNNTLDKSVTRTNTDGTMISEPQNKNGYRSGAGPKVEMEYPQSRAQRLATSVRTGLSRITGLDKLSNSNFSKTIRDLDIAKQANEFLWRNADEVARYGKYIGRGAVAIGVIMDTISIGTSYAEEGEFGEKTQAATGSALGGMAGGWAGAEIGAIIGTAICPGIGTIIGGLLGGIIGGIAGSMKGKELAGWF